MTEITNFKTEWDLSPLLASDDDTTIDSYLEKAKKANYKFINKWENRKDYLKDPKILKEALDEYEKLVATYDTEGDVGYYFWLRTQQEQDNKNIKARVNKLTDFSTKIINDRQFFTYKISKVSQGKQKDFLASNELKEYKHFLEELFANAKYLLSEKEEKIMNLKTPVSHSNWVKMVSTFLSKEEAKVLDEDEKMKTMNFSEILGLVSHTNKKVRDKAAKEFNKIQKKHSEVAEHELNSILQNKKINDSLRKIKRPDLGRHISDDMETAVVDTLVESVANRYEISQRYYKLKAKLLGVKKLKYHERNVEYGDLTKKYGFEEAINLVLLVLNSIDSKFGQILVDFVENGRIDAFPVKGKCSGAFCVHYLVNQPVYIMLNFTNKLNNVLTIAHETGHGVHAILSMKKQNSLNAGQPLSTAEVASTFMEDFVLEKLMKDADDKLKLQLMMAKLNDDVSTIIRQIACYKFEQELHKEFRSKGYLAKEDIGNLFQKHMSAYMGPYVEQSKGSENWWVYWGHIRRFFYNYTYANGLLISKAMQSKVKKDPRYIEKVKEFLSAGSSKSPKDIFLDMGIDISKKEFWDVGLDEIESLLHETEALAKKLGKI